MSQAHAERLLMHAVLTDAIGVVTGRIVGSQYHHRSPGAVDADRRWFASRARDHLYAFENVCDLLGLDADAVRAVVFARAA